VPLFVEELTRAVLENASQRGPSRYIPATLHDSLMARLDRLGPAKELLQIGAVIGSEFSYGLVSAVASIPEDRLQTMLLNLIDAELLYVRGIPPDAIYQFKHALIRDAAYEALLRIRRKEFHSRIAEVLAEQFADRVASAPELLAHHLTEAGHHLEAISYWKLAGRRAAERSANAEAIRHLTKGLELLSKLPEGLQRSRLEWELQINLGPALMATKGFAAPEVGKAYNRALELAGTSARGVESVPVLYGLFAFYITRGQHDVARDLGEQLLTVVSDSRDPDLLLAPHRALGQAYLFLGQQSAARAHLEKGISIYNSAHHGTLSLVYGRDPGVACMGYLAWALWLLGYPEQAKQRDDECLALARELKHPFTLAMALFSAAMSYHFRNDARLTAHFAEAALAISSREGGFAQGSAMATVLRGWAESQQGQSQEGVEIVQKGLAAYRATGSEAMRPTFLACLAGAYRTNGQFADGLLAISEALTLVDKTGERVGEAELYRLKGELTFFDCPSNLAESELCYRTAIEVAREQGSRSWQLRATSSLARLLQDTGRSKEAHKLLAETYECFTEGFETADLKDAKELLDQLQT